MKSVVEQTAQLIFALVLLCVGTVGLLYPRRIVDWYERFDGPGKSSSLLGPRQTIAGVRFGGICGIALGVFYLVTLWR
jgi:hypothetical protein